MSKKKSMIAAAKDEHMHLVTLLKSAQSETVESVLAQANLLKIGVSQYAGQSHHIQELRQLVQDRLAQDGSAAAVEDIVALGKLQVECQKIEKEITDSLVGIVPRAFGSGAHPPKDAPKPTVFPPDGKVVGV